MIPSAYWSIDPRLNSERIVEWCNTLIRFDSCSEEEKIWISERKCSNLKSSTLQHLLRMWGNDLGSLKEWVSEGCKQLRVEGEGKSMQEVQQQNPIDVSFLSILSVINSINCAHNTV